jgi:hypothetical protein
MAPKKGVPDAFTPLTEQSVRGWPFRVRGDGLVTVGTAADGPYARWTFKLTSYSNDAHNPASCLVAEIEERNKPGRMARIGRPTPRYGPKWEGALET